MVAADGDADAGTPCWSYDDDASDWVCERDGAEVARIADGYLLSMPDAAWVLDVPDPRARRPDPLAAALTALRESDDDTARARTASAMIDRLREIRAAAAVAVFRRSRTGAVADVASSLGMTNAEMVAAIGSHGRDDDEDEDGDS